MRSYRYFLALLLPAAVVLPVHAGLIFGRHAKVNPAQRVPELVVQVKNDKNESKRESAARELRDYDPTANPDIVPVLVDVLQNDATPSVRAEAAQSLGKLRPVSQIAGWALEEALKDSSIRVRLQARSSLISYRLSGYHSDNHVAETPAPAPAATAEPKPGILPRTLLNRTSASPAQGQTMTSETPPPPLAEPLIPATVPAPQKSAPPLIPITTVAPQKPPAPSNDAGPDLSPDKE
ncbi:MAG TPA: HEAT repeat domain-containing protein [Gemmataceae bacterium]|nr:HEAT repeat domain-containing protein [Gemmataceae bacterium]